MFLNHQDIRSQIQAKVERTETFDGAIAFWGSGADKNLLKHVSGDKIRIICNLFSGGTNPKVIRALMRKGAQVKRRDDLHAKVYVFSDSVIIGSANYSANGLGLEGNEQKGWVEAGVALEGEASAVVRAWFIDQWEHPLSADVTGPDLKAAQLIWDRRKRQKEALPTIADFDFERPLAQLPLVAWFGDENWDLSKKTKLSIKGLSKAEKVALIEQINDGLEIEGQGDEKLLTPGRWVMCWQRSRNKGVRTADGLWWVCVDRVMPEVFVGEDQPGVPRDAVLAVLKPGPGPFQVKDKKLLRAVAETVKKFDVFRSDYETGEAWYWERQDDFKPFWKSVVRRYRALK